MLSDTAVMTAYDLPNLSNQTIPAKIKDMITLGYNQKLSGDIQFVFYPHWFDGWNKGTTHGFILTFNSEKARDEYLVHPDHKEFGKLVGPLLADVFVIDFWAQD